MVENVLTTNIDTLNLSTRVRNVLRHLGVVTIGDLAELCPDTLLAAPNFAQGSLLEVNGVLEAKGLTLAPNSKSKAGREAVCGRCGRVRKHYG